MTQECKRLQPEFDPDYFRFPVLTSCLSLLNLFFAGFCWYQGQLVVVVFLAAFSSGLCFSDIVRYFIRLWVWRNDE